MSTFKKRNDKNDPHYERKELTANLKGSVIAGAVGSGLTNAFDAITIKK